MRKYIILLFFTHLAYISLISQNYENISTDDLFIELSKNDFEKKEKVDIYRNINLDSAKVFAGLARNFALRDNDLDGIGTSLVRFGLIAKREGQLDSAEYYYLNALRIRKRLGTPKDIIGVYINLVSLYRNIDVNQAIFYFEEAEKLLDEVTNDEYKAKLFNNIGNLYDQKGEYDKALKYLIQSYEIRKEIGVPIPLANSNLNLGIFHFSARSYEYALEYIDEALEIFTTNNELVGIAKCYIIKADIYFQQENYNLAQSYFEEAFLYSELLAKEDQVILQKNLASTYSRLGKTQIALEQFYKCKILFSRLQDYRELSAVNYDIGYIHFEQENFDSSINYLRQALALRHHAQDPDLESKILFFLAESYYQNKNFDRARSFKNDYIKLRDSLYNSYNQALASQWDHEIALKDNALLKFEAEKKKNRTLIIIGVVIFLVLFIVIAFFAVLAHIHEQKKQIAFYQIDDLLREKELAINYARLEEQEKERNRIAQDLHDRIGSMLTVVKLSLGAIETKFVELQVENKEHYEKTNQLLDQACEEVRNISYDLRNSILAKFGLVAALESLINSIKGNPLNIEFKCYNLDNRLDNKIEINVYRIIQELLSNTLKHAKAKNMIIEINRFESLLNITVEDDGVGFLIDYKDQALKGIGLLNIDSRVNDLDGSFNIDSEQGRGTTIMIDIPILLK